jgi:hypothetical protein
MPMSRRSRLISRSVAELAVIVLGVLIALWVDGWAERRGEREAQGFLLASLVEELEANVVALDSTLSRENEVLTGMRMLLDANRGGQPVVSEDSLKTLLISATSYWRSGHFGVAFGVYDAMVATGAAALLPTRELGLRLAKHRAEIENGQSDEPYAERAFEDMLNIIREYGGWYAVVREEELSRLSVPPPGHSADFDGLLGDPDFAEALFSRILWESNIAIFYAEQVAELHTTLELLRAEVALGG